MRSLNTSKIMFTYPTINDANARLSGTIIRINDLPAYIREITNDTLIHFYYLKNRKDDKTMPLSELPERGSLANLNLGYFNYIDKETKNFATKYISRIPMRSTKQGLVTSHFNKNITDFIWEKGFHEMLDNKYPTFKNVFKSLTESSGNNEKETLAFSKNFALSFSKDEEEFYLLFKERCVGKYLPDYNKIKLQKNCTWMRETIEEEGLQNV